MVKKIGAHIFYEDVAYRVPDDAKLLMKGQAMADIDDELERIQKKVEILKGLSGLVPLTKGQKDKISKATDGMIGELQRELKDLGKGGGKGKKPDSSKGDGRPKRTLKKGDKGADVKKLQDKLREKGFGPKKSDSDFGTKTETALKAFQKANGLKANGKAGKNTYDKLFGK